MIALIFGSGCGNFPEADYYEVDGLVSIHAAHLPDQNNWVTVPYYTSILKQSIQDVSNNSGVLSFTFYINQPGSYAFWLMTTRVHSDNESNSIPVRVENNDGFLVDSFALRAGRSNALEWMNEHHQTRNSIFLNFEEAGHYRISIDSQGQSDIIIDRLHLSLNNEYPPAGMGLPETTDPRMDPRLAKRDQPISIPPAWAFGVIYGGYVNQDETVDRISKLVDENYPIDAYWVDSLFWSYGDDDPALEENQNLVRDSSSYSNPEELWTYMNENDIQSGLWIPEIIYDNENESGEDNTIQANFKVDLKPFFDAGLDFLKLERSSNSNIEYVKTAFEAVEQLSSLPDKRGFVLSHLNITHHLDFKQFPTQWSGSAKADWTQPGYPDFNRNMMGGLKENIEMVANPRLSTYEIPYLMHDTGGFSSSEPSQISEELYIRWVQFSAFNGMMQIFSASDNSLANLPFHFSDIAQEQFKRLTMLRNRLFPYHYSQAHRLRATKQKPVTGDGENLTQFLLGGAFLVAPVFEEGLENFEIDFPEGVWYDYWTGREYEGGRRWFVETDLESIPVFVKAGSIIPYREYSQTILNGTNDHLNVEIYTGGVGTFRLYEDDGLTTGYKRGEFATTAFRYFEGENYATFTIGAVVGGFEDLNDEKRFTFHFKHADEPEKILVNGEALNLGDQLEQWSYDPASRVVTVDWLQPNDMKTDFRIEW